MNKSEVIALVIYIIRRTFAPSKDWNRKDLSVLYSGYADEDRQLAEQGIEDYDKGLAVEDT